MSVTVVVPWPRYPVTTPGGKPSKAKNAGKMVPWLSANVVNNLPKPVYRSCVARWREAAELGTIRFTVPTFTEKTPVQIAVRLYKATASLMDPWAVAEGAKPLVDGLEAAGLIVDDKLAHPGHMEALKAGSRAECRVVLELRAVTP